MNMFHESEYIDRRKKQEQEYMDLFSFTLALSACYRGLGLARFVFDRSNAMLALSGIFIILR